MHSDFYDREVVYWGCMKQIKGKISNSVEVCRDVAEKALHLVDKREVWFVHRGVYRRMVFSAATPDDGHIILTRKENNTLELVVVFVAGNVSWFVRYVWGDKEFYPVATYYVSAGFEN